MSPVIIDHEENSPSCHHCHITEPIPLSQLIKTHPLRFPSPDEEDDNRRRDPPDIVARGPKVNAQANTSPNPRQNGDLVQNLLEEVANHEFHRRKQRSLSSNSEEGLSIHSSLRRREEPPKLVRPVHSFLHHVSERSVYKAAERRSLSKSRDSGEEPSSSVELESVHFHKSDRRSSSPDLILNARTLNPHHEYSMPISRGNSANRVNSASQASQVNSASQSRAAGSSRLTTTTTRERETYSKIVHIKDTETQTSKTNTLSRATLSRIRNCASQVSSLLSARSGDKRGRRCGTFACSLPSGLLFAGYGLLIVIGIVVAVALSQRERRISQSSPLQRRPQSIQGARLSPLPRGGPPSFPGAVAAHLPRSAGPRARVVSAGVGPRRRPRPVVQSSPLPTFAQAAPSPLPPRPAPRPAPKPAPQSLLDQDFDYLENTAFDDNDFLLPSKPAPRRAPQPAPTFRPVEIKPQFRAQAPPTRSQQQSSPRRATQPAFRHEFNIQQQQQQQQKTGEPVGRVPKEPEVQIIKSWSNRNGDGTFSWGYLNTDGSFKNETKGNDCVVRGVYGYIDQDTGETVTFNYESGNPCDPNAPDYYFDYEDGTVNIGGEVVQRPQLPSSSAARRRFQ